MHQRLPREPESLADLLSVKLIGSKLCKLLLVRSREVEIGSASASESDGGVDATTLEGVLVLTAYTLASFPAPVKEQDGDERVKAVKESFWNKPPPRAASGREVKENCRGWAVRVLQKLMERGLVEERKVDMVRGLMQPV